MPSKEYPYPPGTEPCLTHLQIRHNTHPAYLTGYDNLNAAPLGAAVIDNDGIIWQKTGEILNRSKGKQSCWESTRGHALDEEDMMGVIVTNDRYLPVVHWPDCPECIELAPELPDYVTDTLPF